MELAIMCPLAGLRAELDYVKACIDRVAGEVGAETGVAIGYLAGTMIELPRAALRAHVIAATAEFFSFGTNDLTQTTFGMSRDAAAAFIPPHPRQRILGPDPLIPLFFNGLGAL